MSYARNPLILAAAVAIAAAASQAAQASFQYDLRFAPGQAGEVDAHNVALNSSSPATYTLQLWGQITGDTDLTNDSWVSGFVSEKDVQGAIPAFTSGGVTGVTLGSHVSNVGAVGSPNQNISPDGITDWGSFSTTSTVGYTLWRAGAATPFADGTTDSESEQVDANTWEVLLATYTVAVGGINNKVGTTSFTMLIPPQVKSGIVVTNSLNYLPDGATTPQSTFSIIGSATFSTVPEPASLTLLALGGLTLATRRRRQA